MFNPKSTIYQTEWLDLVFANRNKTYGAYELRQNYNKRLGQALLFTSFFVFLLFSYPFIMLQFKTEAEAPPILQEENRIIPIDLPAKEKIQEPVKPAAAAPAAPPLKSETTDFKTPLVVSKPDADVIEPPTVKQLENSVIASDNNKGDATIANALPREKGSGQGGDGKNATDAGSGDAILTPELLQKYPEFPGGMEAFANYLRKNLRYPERAVEAGASGKVYVSFVVEKDGHLTDIKVIRGIGYGCDEEAARVLKKSPAWTPGIQNERAVRVLYTIPLHFQMGE